MEQKQPSKRPRLFVINSETVLRIVPDLAMEIGLNESIILLQLEYLVTISTTEEREGEIWTYQSLHHLKNERFPFWSISTIRRGMLSLEKQGLIKIGEYNKLSFDHTQWYCLNQEGINKLKSVHIEQTIYQIEKSKRSKRKIEPPKKENRLGQNGTTIPENPSENPSENPLKANGVDFANLTNQQKAKEAWEYIKSQQRGSMKISDYRTWIEPIEALGFDERTIVLGCANSYTVDWVSSRLGTTILRTLKSSGLAENYKIVIVIKP